MSRSRQSTNRPMAVQSLTSWGCNSNTYVPGQGVARPGARDGHVKLSGLHRTTRGTAQSPGVMRGIGQILLYLATAVVLTGVYLGANYLGLYLKLHYYGIAPLWPAAGVSVALLWLGGFRWAPVVLVG